jgi:membrane-associated phospholipid phosphatase
MRREATARPERRHEEKPPEKVGLGHEKRVRRRNDFLPMAIGISGGVILATAAFWFFKKQAEYVVRGVADPYDTALLDAIQSHQSKPLDRMMHAVTQMGTHTAIVCAAGVTALAMLRKKRMHDAWTVLISTGGAMALNSAMKAIFQRKRPQEQYRYIKLPRSHSFPSGHSLLTAATYPIVAHHLVQKASAPVQIVVHGAVSFLILSVGYSRVYFAVHFPSDVLAGFAAGFGWLGLTSLTHTFIDRDLALRRRANQRDDSAPRRG